MIQRITYFSLLAIFAAFTSCGGEQPEENDTLITDTVVIDTSLGIDTLDINPIDTVGVDSAGYIDEEVGLTTQIEKTYGKQWDFCDCVVKNDSVNTAIQDAGDDADFDAILTRMDTIDVHCKEMLTTANTTPDERARHERKVRKCLKGK